MSYKGIPNEVRIGHHVFKVRVETPEENKAFKKKAKAAGYVEEDYGNIIHIRSGMALSQARTTLLHELLHCVGFIRSNLMTPPDFEEWKIDDVYNVWEHFFINMYQDAVIDLLRENPKLLEFLLSR